MIGTGEIINLLNNGTIRVLPDGRFTQGVAISNSVVPSSTDINVTELSNLSRVIGRQELLDYVIKDDITYFPLKIEYRKIPNYVDLKQYSTKLNRGNTGYVQIL